MRILTVVILSLIIAHTDQVLGQKRGKGKKNYESPCGKRFLRKLNKNCYYFAMKKMNWFGAQNNCLRKGLNLADLSNSEDYNAVLHYLRAIGNMEDYWFGGNDLQTEGQFTYISNGQMVKFLGDNAALLPTHRSNLDDCLEVRLRENNTMITDDNCQEKQYFVCETNAPKCATPTSTSDAETKHSHEHLHHFHHNAGKRNENGTDTEGVESDSRPADNTNSTEVGTSQENQDESTSDNDETTTTTATESVESQEANSKQTPDNNANPRTQGPDETTQGSQGPDGTTQGTQNPDKTTTEAPNESSTLEEGATTLPGDAGEDTTPSAGAESELPNEGETAAPGSEEPPAGDVTTPTPPPAI